MAGCPQVINRISDWERFASAFFKESRRWPALGRVHRRSTPPPPRRPERRLGLVASAAASASESSRSRSSHAAGNAALASSRLSAVGAKRRRAQTQGYHPAQSYRSTKAADFGSYLKLKIVPSLIFWTASSITKSGTRNHSCGITGCPKRAALCCVRAET
jgi:hypothetical protein